MKQKRDQRTILIVSLLVIVSIMVVGFAAFATNLTINGTANISSNWCVGFDNTKTTTYEITKGKSTGTRPTATIGYDGTTCSTNYVPIANLGAVFYQPGDKIEYTLTIANKGSVDAAIESIEVNGSSVTSNQTITNGNIIWKVYMPESTTLSATTGTTTMKVSAEFQNTTDISNLTTGGSSSLTVGINVVQDDGNGGMDITPAKFTGTIYRWNSTGTSDGDSIVSVSGTKWVETDGNYSQGAFETEALCQADIDANGYAQYGVYCEQKTVTTGGVGEYTTNASTLNKTYYLKHDVVDDIITNSYVCFVYNNAEHCMKGGDNGASFEANTQTIKDYQTFYNLNTVYNPSSSNLGCSYDSWSRCTSDVGNGISSISTQRGGNVVVMSSDGSCRIQNSVAGCG